MSVEERDIQAATPDAAASAGVPAAVRTAGVVTLAAAPVPVQAGSSRPVRVAAARPAPTALARAQEFATQLAPRLQYHITRLGPTGQLGLAALVAAVVFAASALLPARQALQSLNADIVRAQHPSTAVNPDQAVPKLVDSLPTRAQIPAVIGVIYTQAKESGVALDTGHYAYSPAKSGALARYDLEFPVKANYPDIRNFINRTLTAVPAAALAKLRVERKTVGDQAVSANIGFVVFIRSEQSP